MLGPTLPRASDLTLAHPSIRRRAGGSSLPASWGLTLTLGRPPRGPSQRDCRRTPGIGDLRVATLDSPFGPAPPRPAHTRAARVPPIIQGGRMGRALPAPVTFEGPQRQNAGAHSPARQRPDLRPCLHSPQTADRACRPTGANLYPRSAPKGPLPRGLVPQRLALGTPRASAPDPPCRPATTRVARGAATHSGRENGQGPPSPQ